MSDVLQIYQGAKRSTASGRGVSYHEVAANCGRRRYLTQMHPNTDTREEDENLRTGTYYHALQEMWRNGGLPAGVALDVSEIQDAEWAEAARLFDWYRGYWDLNFWGTMVGTEVPLPTNEAHKERVREFFGHDEVTGAVDLIVMMNEADVARVEADRGVTLRGPGLYFIDYKTSKSRKSDDTARADYTETMQSMTYPVLWNLAGGEQVKGMIFDVIIKHAALRRVQEGKNGASIQTFVAYPQPNHSSIVKNSINRALRERDSAEANAYACYYKGQPCPFLTKGLCGRE